MAKLPWRDVPGYPGLQVSEDLQFRTLPRVMTFYHPIGGLRQRKVKERRLKVTWAKGCPYPTIFWYAQRRPLGVHVLVCLAWHGLPSAGKTKALHRDDDPSNFTPENLYWGNSKDNAQDAIRNGRMAYGERHGSHTMPHRWKRNPVIQAEGN